MESDKVYQCLMKLFPQVDSRILKAVAMENSKDIDAAAEIVVCEVMPYLPKKTMASCSNSHNQSSRVPPNEAVDKEESNQLRQRKVLLGKRACSYIEPDKVVRDTRLKGAASYVDSLESPNVETTSKLHENNNDEAADIETDELILFGNPENSTEIGKDKSSVTLNALGAENSMLYEDIEIKESGSLRNPAIATDSEKPERGPVELKSEPDIISQMGDSGDTFSPVESWTNQSSRIGLLEEIIGDTKDNKKTLFQAMQSIINLMREVELKEEAAEQAKEEASRGGLDILLKVEDLKGVLPHAKEANDMHAADVYGEKGILATEVRELQNRLLRLSLEGDLSLSSLDEMRQTLEIRQAAAEELLKTAHLEKLEKEESAHNALAEQEAIMVKVVEESKSMQQVAEENAKIRKFLIDRGQIVDSLQGEISVICEDVRLLKENFDERIPLIKSISSSQTSCILASSGSSLKSMASDLGLEQGEPAKTVDKRSETPSVDEQSVLSRSPDLEERDKADDKELLEDGWEILDKDAELWSEAI